MESTFVYTVYTCLVKLFKDWCSFSAYCVHIFPEGGGGGNSTLKLPGCVSIKVMDMGLFSARSE